MKTAAYTDNYILNSRVVGVFDRAGKNYGFVIPDNRKLGRDIFVSLEQALSAKDGQKVVCEILRTGSEKRAPEGRIIELLGYMQDSGVDLLSVIKDYDLSEGFPEKAERQAGQLAESIPAEEYGRRRDLREELTVTIDGEDAKDLDDAVSLKKQGDNYLLGVHIADVSHYVREDTALDREALKRGTSVYLTGTVIPMLPKRLSNGLCSLNPREDKLTLSCLMTISPKGEVIDHEIVESVIRSDKRMTYNAVNALLAGKEVRGFSDFAGMIREMRELSMILREKRKQRGSIDFDLPESKIILNKRGKVVDIKPYERNDATRLIEEFMLIANETVAEHYFWLKLPFVYRVHEEPDPDKMKGLAAFLKNLGYGLHLKGSEVHPKEIQKLLASCENTGEESLIERLSLRSMQRAKYSTDCIGHFGLACRYYCHFTSPIRRYPDLQIHRIIKEDLQGRLSSERIESYEARLPEVCLKTSAMERLADDAEREIERMKKAEYMSERIGEIYEGIVSSVTAWGLYVELPNTVEGLVHVSNMDDYYSFDEERYELVGEITGKRYSLGQKVRIRVNYVDITMRTIDFILERS